MKLLLNILLAAVISTTAIAQKVKLTVKINAAHPFVILDDTSKYYGNILEIPVSVGSHYISIYENQFKWSGGIITDTLIINGREIHSSQLGLLKINNSKYEISYNFKLSNKNIPTAPKENILSSKNLLGKSPLLISYDSDSLSSRKVSRIFPMDGNNIGEKLKLGSISFKQIRSDENIGESKWFPVLIGSAIVFGGIAAYSKTAADKKYDEYLLTNNRELLNQTNRMDIVSAVALGLMEVNIGYIIYELLIQ